ncbi:helix-turn-helix domain-containing protein [Ensifer sp. BR816]|uniref:helix-turn-helix domain-containing protein n=1 Tax=Rhizobium sp. (strain BR816) TaxID=1057002 RepID=UPI000363A280|nr:helix-turn-helix domain-containing protein [Ensifer sp. BR816]
MKLLTEAEAAQLMRCSREKIKCLRLSGNLPYVPGRPVLIDEADLLAMVEAAKAETMQKSSQRHLARPAEARRWAMQAVLLRRDRRKKD